MSAPNLTEPTLTAPVPPDAWDLFVLRHSKRGNLVIHFVSFLVYYGALIGLAVTWNPWWIVGLFVSGAIGSSGHYLFDDGGVKLREATFSPQVVFFVTIMFWRLARGVYFDDIAAARERYEVWLAAQPAAPETLATKEAEPCSA